MKKVLYISGTRADYGLMRYTLKKINEHNNLDLSVVVTGMHLMSEFGSTIDEIKKDNFKHIEIPVVHIDDSRQSMASFIGDFITHLTKEVEVLKPDIILVLGDRAEMLGGAIVGVYLNIPVVQLHGGEVTSTVDEFARHAITKLSHIHLPSTKNSADRISKMGEDEWRIKIVGAPGLDQIVQKSRLSKKQIFNKLGLKKKRTILVLQHSVSTEIEHAGFQIEETLKAVRSLGYQTIIIYPNADSGGREIIKRINRYKEEELFYIFKNLPHSDFLSLLSSANVLVGNSSCGIIESASFKLPVVNIGIRQEGRERPCNVIDVTNDEEKIILAIKKAISSEFKNQISKCKNPYGDGFTAERVSTLLDKLKIDNNLMDKRISY